MRKFLLSICLPLGLSAAAPVSATTFPTLTTIYVASGVIDSGSTNGRTTAVMCTNVSGNAATLRVLVLSPDGAPNSVQLSIPHAATRTVATQDIPILAESAYVAPTGTFLQGGLLVEATESGIFCTAAVIDASQVPPLFTLPLHMVRINPHPGSVE